AGQKVEDVVAAAVTSLGNQAKVRGQSTAVGGTSSLLVLVGAGNVIRQLARALLDLALLVGLGIVLVLLGHGLHLIDGVHDTNERTPGDTGQRVAAGADFAVNLEATAEAEIGISKRAAARLSPETHAW